MAVSFTQLLSAALVCLACLSVMPGHQSQARSVDSSSAHSQTSSQLGHILRRRSSELQAPPQIYAPRFGNMMHAAPVKRDDGVYWIWMPASGYMSVPRDEVVAQSRDTDGMGNLLRYGRK
ncbi:hypothetical protein BaRGS_00011628 [Batillaria attramentaria]|uniref:Uncharacterized protein n=1 Tax=Batillaria attramentaria TaxID=370345 RepID=A0ABD0LCR3_9CAEN